MKNESLPAPARARAYVAADEKCDVCGNGLREGRTFYDAKTPLGPWAWMCFRCFRQSGATLGLGRGQEYDSKTDEKLRG